MNCFVIMPFSPSFDDVYGIIKNSVESTATEGKNRRCFRLDDSRPAGRITDRLLAELRTATFCVADLTETRPNVMWEMGFAMALNKPVIIITQSLQTLPFDIKDMQSIEYDRTRLHATLGAPLRRSILDTIGNMASEATSIDIQRSEEFGALLSEVSQLKEIVSEAVEAWKTPESKVSRTPAELAQLSGHWFNTETSSHIYASVLNGELVSPYCYNGNGSLTGVYFAWRRIGDYWFARYKWLDGEPFGFTFLRQQTTDTLVGAWWSSESEVRGALAPPTSSGVTATWVRQSDTPTPYWAKAFLDEVARDGLPAALARGL
jgi:hypothetical protein